MDDLEQILPAEIANAAARSGNELVIPLNEAKWAVRIASQNHIAVLGVEAFRVLAVGLVTETYSGYEFQFGDDWPGFVQVNNDAALRFLEENGLGKGHGYILTTTSEREFKDLPRQL